MTQAPPVDVVEDGPSALVLHDVAVAYNRKLALHGVSASIGRGQVVGLVGPNGGGKSTLLKAILGVVPLARGCVMLFDVPSGRNRARMACVPQREVVDWDFPVTVRDVVMMGRYPHTGWLHRPRSIDRAVVKQMLDRVGMSDLANRQIGQLSGGQQQRVFIARALAQQADVLLLDEPMSGIDSGTQDLILAIIQQERRDGKIILIATHDLAGAASACDCLCCVNHRMVSYGPVAQTYTPENMAATFGGSILLVGPDPHSPATINAGPGALESPAGLTAEQS